MVHILWSERTAADVVTEAEDDVIVFPGEAAFDKASKLHTYRKAWFWKLRRCCVCSDGLLICSLVFWPEAAFCNAAPLWWVASALNVAVPQRHGA